jgi:hypothetical protein
MVLKRRVTVTGVCETQTMCDNKRWIDLAIEPSIYIRAPNLNKFDLRIPAGRSEETFGAHVSRRSSRSPPAAETLLD